MRGPVVSQYAFHEFWAIDAKTRGLPSEPFRSQQPAADAAGRSIQPAHVGCR